MHSWLENQNKINQLIILGNASNLIKASLRSLQFGFQDGSLREEAESMFPKVKSWRDTGDTPCSQGHREERKLWPLHTSSRCRESPLHIKWGNQEGPRCQSPVPRWLGKTWTTRWVKWYVVLPQTSLGQISIVPWTDRPPPGEKRETE
jgi:hypothetical protein